tara:strand:+ start:152 stop:1120 length:969 start_codon:yes stop_codon:yes gene_type:complete
MSPIGAIMVITGTAGGIASAEAFGTPSISGPVSPTGIASAEAFGTLEFNAAFCWEDLYNQIRAHFDDNTTVTAAYDNVSFEPPDSGLWAKVSILTTTAEQTGYGTKIAYRKFGELTVDIHTEVGHGDGDALALADSVRALFRDVTVVKAKFEQPSISNEGRTQRWHVTRVSCPFYVDEEADPTALGAATSGALDGEYLHNKLRSRFKTQVADAESVQVQYDNSNLDHPDDDKWIMLTILDGTTERTASGLYRTVGVMDAAVFVPIGAGDQSALALADRITKAFMPSTHDGVKYKIPYVTPVGRTDKWWQVTVSCPYQVDETT